MQIKDRLNYIYQLATTPRAYAAYAGIGVGLTLVLGIIAGKEEAKREMEKSPEEKNEETILDKVIEKADAYKWPIISACATAMCIDKSITESEARLDMVNDYLKYAQTTASLYRGQVPALVAASVVNGFSKKPADEGREWFCLKDMTPDGDIYFQATQLEVLSAEYKLNKLFANKNAVSVADFIRFLPIDMKINERDTHFGWDIEVYYENEDYPWIDFSHYTVTDEDTGQIINVISPIWGPQYVEDNELFYYGHNDYPTER